MTLYAVPQVVVDQRECAWYHTMALPEVGEVQGRWDLRATVDEYLGGFDFKGKRCLDIGTASGYLTFEMERRGASGVVSVDLDPLQHEWEIVPFADPRFDRAAEIERKRTGTLARQRGYWLAHRLLGSRARVHYGSAYGLPDALGRFDVALVGMMLPHVRDPLRVLEQVARLAETIIVTQQAPGHPDAYAYFMPDPTALAPSDAWWSMSEACVERMLGVLGFEIVRKVRAEHACPARGDREACTAYVATRRHAGSP